MPDNETEQYRRALISVLKEQGGLKDSRLEAAFRAVQRHIFLPGVPLDQAYADDAIAVKRDDDGRVISSSSQPSMMLLMLNQLRLRPGHNVLEIGTGTGYNASIMQHIVGEQGAVTSVEIDRDQYEQARNNLQRAGRGQVQLVHADGALGYAPRAAYDRIIATAGIWDVPRRWVEQLKPGGILVAPLWLDGLQFSAALVAQHDGTLTSRINLPCGFIHLRGAAAGPRLNMRVGSSSLFIMCNDVERIDSAALHLTLSDDAEDCHLGASLTTGDYWHGFLPYLMLNSPQDFHFVTYFVDVDQQAYGLNDNGFALITQGSACFVPYHGQGSARCFGSADSYLALEHILQIWDALGHPGRERLRLRLIPKERGEPQVAAGKLYSRNDHYIHAWQEITV